MLLVVDLALINASIMLGLRIWKYQFGGPFSSDFLLSQAHWFPILNVLWLLSAVLSSFYDTRVTAHVRTTFKALVQQASFLLVAYLFFYFLSLPGEVPRRFVLFFIGISFVSIGVWRYVYTVYLSKTPFQRRAIIIGGGAATANVAQVTQNNAFPYYHIVGYVQDDNSAPSEFANDLPLLGSMSKLPQIAERTGASEVIITSIESPNETLIRSLVECQEQGLQITPLPNIYEEMTGRIPVDMVSEGWLGVLPLHHASTGVIFPLFKRSVDISLSIIGLVCLSILLPFVVVAIRLDSKGSAFYRQDRFGKGGRTFRAFKFRSMEAESQDGNSPLWTEPSDPRITRVGRILRATHIDEFPQFLNILKGDMSAVGPRPERLELALQFEKEIPFYRLRHSVRPGMAGWALIKQGNTSSVQDAWMKLEYDLYYIKHQSVWLDVIILLKTFVDAFTFRGR